MTETTQPKRKKPMTQIKFWFLAFLAVTLVSLAIGTAMTLYNNHTEANLYRTLGRVVDAQLPTPELRTFVVTIRYFHHGEETFWVRHGGFIRVGTPVPLAINVNDTSDIIISPGRWRAPEVVMTATLFPASFTLICFAFFMKEKYGPKKKEDY